jgi:fructokinase
MMTRTVYGIGETICDIIFKHNQPQTAKAGGSTFNAMVSLGRMGVDTSFISKIGDDKLGTIILDFMQDNHISSESMTIWEGHKTDIALAFLDEKGDADYSFYKEYDKQFVEANIPEFNKDDILLMGSYFSLNPLLRPLIGRVIKAAKEAQVIIYYDPNFRSSHLHEVNELRPIIFSNMEEATIVRGSDEDFENIFTIKTLTEMTLNARKYTEHLLITQGSKGVLVSDRENNFHFPAQELTPLSTIGAGDSFNAGFIYALLKYNITFDGLKNLEKKQWDKLVSLAVSFSSDVCQSYENYISKEFAQNLKNNPK